MTSAGAAASPTEDREAHLSQVSRLKGGGYLSSTASVILLAIPGVKAAMEAPVLFLCLTLGAATSIAGMYLRWRSHRLEQKEKSR